jgi:hypothetical protein
MATVIGIAEPSDVMSIWESHCAGIAQRRRAMGK